MELGEKLRTARLEAGLSQRALCGDEITRNMLSQIENGAAHPSMKTLRYLAARLGRPISYFLEEEGSISPNHRWIIQARTCFDRRDWEGALTALGEYQVPDGVFDREYQLLRSIVTLSLAEQAIAEHREPYARRLLDGMELAGEYCSEELRRKQLLLMGRLGDKVAKRLPSLEEELLLRAREAMDAGDLSRAAAWLDAMEERPEWWYLFRGRVYFQTEDYRNAASALKQAEKVYEKETASQLEICFRELGDYEKAYFYACKRIRD